MKSQKHLIPLLILVIALSAITVPPVRAGTADPGLVLISPSIQGPFASGTTVTYQVRVSNMAPFNGWDVLVQTDVSAIDPKSVSIAGNILTSSGLSMTEFINCVNGGVGIPVNQLGNLGCGVFDGPGIVHSAAVGSGPPPMTASISGLLSTISYTAGTGTLALVHISSVLLSNGGPTPVPNTTQDGIYGMQSRFVHGKLSWTHHLSLMKNNGRQSFTATVRDESSTAHFVQVFVASTSGGSFSTMSAVQQLQPGVVTKIPFGGSVDPSLVGHKICFTATLAFGESSTTMIFTSTVTKSGCFAVVA